MASRLESQTADGQESERYAAGMTYSIVARDPQTGEIGVATQSQAFAVGGSVSWAVPGVGVIATQSIGEPMYGELGLDLLRGGLTAVEALTALRSVDPSPERRQVAMADTHGGIDVYTGKNCVAAAGHCVGPYSAALGNMLIHEGTWDRMVEAFESASGPLAFRLLEALRVAEDRGGDLRGSRSAAVMVVRGQRSGRPWRDYVMDLRVDDHGDPVGELTRMAHYSVRYHAAVRAFESGLDGSTSDALTLIEGTDLDVAKEPELALLHASVLAKAGRTQEAARLMEALANVAPQFVETARRFRDARLVEPSVFDHILTSK